MSRKTQIIVLLSLVALLVVVFFLNRNDSTTATTAVNPGSFHSPLITVDNPRLQIEKIDSARASNYAGSHRNIFSAIAPPPTPKPGEAAAAAEKARQPVGPMPPPPPPPVTLPVKFYGYAADGDGNHRRGFFTNGDDVYIVGEGELLLGHFRVLRIGNDRVEFEDTSVGRRGSAPMEESAAPTA